MTGSNRRLWMIYDETMTSHCILQYVSETFSPNKIMNLLFHTLNEWLSAKKLHLVAVFPKLHGKHGAIRPTAF